MKTMAGVALAAVVSACALAGGVGRAEAAMFVAGGTGTNAQDGVSSYSVDFSTNPLSLFHFSYYNFIPSDDPEIGGYTDSGEFNLKANDFGIYSTDDGFFTVYAGFKDVFGYLVFDYCKDGRCNLTSLPELGVNLSALGGVSYSGDLSVVPLPASAPMFGAALLALGGFAFARRRGAVA